MQQCYYVTGTSDFILVVKTPDMETYKKFTHEVFFDIANVLNCETGAVMGFVKAGLLMPVL